MALCEVRWFSHTLLKQVSTFVVLPETGDPPFKTMYLLHGLSDDYAAWVRRTRIEWYVRELPLMVVMPDGFRGFFTDNEQGPPYAKYIARELVGFVERNFPAQRSRSGRCVGGLSMGGYGALRLALGHPQVFSSAHSHSGALMRGSRRYDAKKEPEFSRIFGGDPRGSEHDLLTLAKRAKRAGKLPRLRIDCGSNDFLIEESRQFHQELTNMKVDHEYEEHPGDHSWDYWDAHIQSAIRFHITAR